MSNWNTLPPLTLASALALFAPIATTVTLNGVQTLTNKTLTSPVISGGTIDNTVIGGATPAAATFASVVVSTSSLSTPMRITSDGLASNLTQAIYTDSPASASGNNLFQRYRGTLLIPTVVALNDRLMGITAQGYDGNSSESAVRITAFVDGAVSDGVVPGRLLFEVANTSGALVEALRLKAGEVVFNEGSTDIDFRVESDTSINAFIVDAGLNAIGMFTAAPTAPLDMNANLFRLRTAKTPASASDTAVGAGLFCWDSSFLYISTGVNTWKRVAIATW